MIRTDLGLHAAVRAALRRVIGARAERIGVVVRDGIVTLTGTIDTPHEKLAEVALLERYRVSRAVFREAVRLLEHEPAYHRQGIARVRIIPVSRKA